MTNVNSMGLSPEEVTARTAAAEERLKTVDRQYRDFANTHQVGFQPQQHAEINIC